MTDNVLINKAAQLERCIARVKDEFYEKLEEDITRQDAVILNLQRACQICIDMGSHFIRTNRLGIPQYSSDVFEILHTNKIINKTLSESLIAMVGFRNIAIHDYSKMNLDIVRSIVKNHLTDFTEFSSMLITSKK